MKSSSFLILATIILLSTSCHYFESNEQLEVLSTLTSFNYKHTWEGGTGVDILALPAAHERGEKYDKSIKNAYLFNIGLSIKNIS